MGTVQKLDQNAMKTAQATTILLLLVAFVLGRGAWPLVAFVGVAQWLSALGVPFAPYRLLYQGIRRAGWIQPNLQPDTPEPHRFAMKIGTAFNLVAAIALWGGLSIVGWVLVWIVIALANLNFWFGFCLGCWMYYQLGRFGVNGFETKKVSK